MQRRLAVALSISVLLIGGATWFRLTRVVKASRNLIVENKTTTSNLSSAALSEADIQTTATPTNATTSESLNTTDLVGRQFMTDYLGLASNGQVTDANVSKLVDNYATNISNLDSFRPFATADITVVPTSKDTLDAYSKKVTAVYTKYHALGMNITNSAGDLSSTDSKNFAPTMLALSKLALSAAEELKAVPVPDSLSVDHLQLVNNGISSANALKAIGSINDDSVTAYAALNAQAQNASEATTILLDIQSKLLASGILFNAGL
jgi:hypothetical protein